MSKENKTVAELIQGFEDDIIYDCHGFFIRYGRSLARKELMRRGRSALEEIDKHLAKNPPSDVHELKAAWTHLRFDIKNAPEAAMAPD